MLTCSRCHGEGEHESPCPCHDGGCSHCNAAGCGLCNWTGQCQDCMGSGVLLKKCQLCQGAGVIVDWEET